MAAAVRYSRLAREDLLQIWVGIALNDPRTADRILDRIEENCGRLRDYPQLGVGRPDIAVEARALIIERWLALYRLIEGGVQVVRIVDGARDLARLEWPAADWTGRRIALGGREGQSISSGPATA